MKKSPLPACIKKAMEVSVLSVHRLSLRKQITAIYRAWFIIHKGLFKNSWDCNCNDKVVKLQQTHNDGQ